MSKRNLRNLLILLNLESVDHMQSYIDLDDDNDFTVDQIETMIRECIDSKRYDLVCNWAMLLRLKFGGMIVYRHTSSALGATYDARISAPTDQIAYHDLQVSAHLVRTMYLALRPYRRVPSGR